jgi:hypothetical protein
MRDARRAIMLLLALAAARLEASLCNSMDLRGCIDRGSVALQVVILEKLADPRGDWVSETESIRELAGKEREEYLRSLERGKFFGTIREYKVEGDCVTVTRSTCPGAFYRVAVRAVWRSRFPDKGRAQGREFKKVGVIHFFNPCPAPGESIFSCASYMEFMLQPGRAYMVLSRENPGPSVLPFNALSCYRAEEMASKKKIIAILWKK